MSLATALDLIGGTPLLQLDRIRQGPGRVLAKAEFLQPGGSVKDRAALAILTAARADGRLRPGMPVVQMSSGNMGAGLAMVCGVLGHPLIVTMSAGNSPARARMMEALGARVVLTPQVDGLPGQVTGADIAAAAALARDVAEAEGGFYVDQFNAPEGVDAHRLTTGPEILTDAGAPIDAWVAAVGTGATFVGVALALREANPNILCAVVEAAGSQVLAGKAVTNPRHRLQGASYGAPPPHWRSGLMDLSLPVTDEEAEEWRGRLSRQEGLYVGYTAAANVCAAVRLLESGRLGRDATVATVLCDTGLKYG
jgi:cysteine synthase A